MSQREMRRHDVDTLCTSLLLQCTCTFEPHDILDGLLHDSSASLCVVQGGGSGKKATCGAPLSDARTRRRGIADWARVLPSRRQCIRFA